MKRALVIFGTTFATSLTLVLTLVLTMFMMRPETGTEVLERRFWNDRARTMKHLYVLWGRGIFMVRYAPVRFPAQHDTSVLAFDLKKCPPKWEFAQLPGDTGPVPWDWWIFNYHSGPFPGYANGKSANLTLGFRIWPIALLSGLVTLVGMRVLLRQCRRVDRARCRSCGYDLRATPTRCPECGMVPATEVAA